MPQFPHKKRGERLTADHVNALGQGINDALRMRPGSFIHTSNGYQASNGEWNQRIAIVVDPDDYVNADELVCENLAMIRFRYYDQDADPEDPCGGWLTNEDPGNSACLDYKAVGMVKPEVGTILSVWWSGQRNEYIPIPPFEMYMVCRFAGTWDKGDEKTVERLNDNANWTVATYPNEFVAINLAVDVAVPTGSTYRKCGILRYRSKWTLLWAECG
jgi:hypothetical protein